MLNLYPFSTYISINLSQGFNGTLTEPVDAQGRRIDQFKEMELKLHPDLKEPLKKLCDDPKTTTIVLSGSDRSVLDEVYCFHIRFALLLAYSMH